MNVVVLEAVNTSLINVRVHVSNGRASRVDYCGQLMLCKSYDKTPDVL